jgi:hypothetical protein
MVRDGIRAAGISAPTPAARRSQSEGVASCQLCTSHHAQSAISSGVRRPANKVIAAPMVPSHVRVTPGMSFSMTSTARQKSGPRRARTWSPLPTTSLAAAIAVHLLPYALRPVPARRTLHRPLRWSMGLNGRCETDKPRHDGGCDHQLLHTSLLPAMRRSRPGASCRFDAAAPLPGTVSSTRIGGDQCSATGRNQAGERYIPLQSTCPSKDYGTYHVMASLGGPRSA